MKNVLIIFTKNAVHGKVKTRLAATVGNNKAFEIYTNLIEHTFSITKQITADKIVFYSDEIMEDDVWKNSYQKQVQQGFNLGERMLNAFDFSFKNKFDKAVIIGTDCPELTTQIILEAFKKLEESDVVIGPAADGGYYLLGMKKLHAELFKNIEWSTDTVLKKTIERCNKYHLSYYRLLTLHDVDDEKDLKYLNA